MLDSILDYWPDHYNQNLQIFFCLDFGLGISLSLLLVLILVAIINKVSIQSSSKFSQDFPCWRGIGLFILYLWVIGVNIFIFQKFKISHRLILKFDDFHYSTSTQILVTAGAHTSIFLVLYLFYILQLTQTIPFMIIQPSYIVLVCWILFIINMVVPLPVFNYKGRLYCIKLLVKSMFAFCIGTTFPIVYATDQFVSLITPLKDLAYTVCYFTNQNFSQTNSCGLKNKFEVVFIAAMLVYLARILQCIRQGITNNKYWGTNQMLNTFKYSCSLITVLLSYFHTFLLISIEFIDSLWVFYSLDYLRNYIDNLLLYMGYQNGLEFTTKKQLQFLFKAYNNIPHQFLLHCDHCQLFNEMCLDIDAFFQNNIGCIQQFQHIQFMLRNYLDIQKGFWNVLRIQKQHLQNCVNFKALPNVHQLQKILKPSIFQQSDFENILTGYFDKMTVNREHIDDSFLRLIKYKLKQKKNICLSKTFTDQDFQTAYHKIKSIYPEKILQAQDHKQQVIIDQTNCFLSSY